MGFKGSRLKRLRQAFKAGLLDRGDGLVAHGLGIERLPSGNVMKGLKPSFYWASTQFSRVKTG
jgi:hypothetical protein